MVVVVFDALDQPFGEHLLRDGLALNLSAIGDKELGFAFLPDFAGAFQTQESVQRPTCLAVHGRHIDGSRHEGLWVDLGMGMQ